MKNSHSASYAAAGVDITAGYEAVKRIKIYFVTPSHDRPCSLIFITAVKIAGVSAADVDEDISVLDPHAPEGIYLPLRVLIL